MSLMSESHTMGDEHNPADNRVRIGIIGCAAIARKLCRAIDLSPNAVLWAIGSRSLDKVKSFSCQNGINASSVRLYGSYEEVVQDPCVDAVYLPLPTGLRLHWAVLAARSKKHVLLEKPTALDLAELDRIIEACSSNRVQFMDGSMWLHHPRTSRMSKLLADPQLIGHLDSIHSTSMFCATSEFLERNIRIKPDLDGLGALGDLGWYSIGFILWAMAYRLPTSVVALPRAIHNDAGVILACSASLFWDRDRESRPTAATFHCSFLAFSSMDLALVGSNGSIHVTDMTLPIEEETAPFELTPAAKFAELHIGWTVKPETIHNASKLPQEALMVREFAGLVQRIKRSGCEPEGKWLEISRKTQLVLDAVKKSIDLDYKPMYL